VVLFSGDGAGVADDEGEERETGREREREEEMSGHVRGWGFRKYLASNFTKMPQ
jgi:hypothetical protein